MFATMLKYRRAFREFSQRPSANSARIVSVRAFCARVFFSRLIKMCEFEGGPILPPVTTATH